MSVVNAAGNLAAKTAVAAGLNALLAWGTRFVSWHPQATVPGLVSACVYTTSEFFAKSAQEILSPSNPEHGLLKRGYKVERRERIRKVSAAVATIASIVLTPRIANRMGYQMGIKSAVGFTLPSMMLSFFMPPTKRNDIFM